MDSFLQQQVARGYVDSKDAEFGIDLERSLKKLSQFGMVQQHDYLMKALQAAHALEGRELECNLGVRENVVSFLFEARDDVSPEEVGETILGRAKKPSPAATHLASAMLSARGIGSPQVEWIFGKSRLSLGDEVKTVSRYTPGESTRGRFVCRHPPRFWKKSLWRLLPSYVGEQHFAVYNRARFYPDAIKLDGREIERGWVRKSFAPGAWFDYMSLAYYLAEGYLCDPLLPKFTFPGSSVLGFKRVKQTTLASHFRNKAIGNRGNVLTVPPVPDHRFQVAPTLFRLFQGISTVPTEKQGAAECGLAVAIPLSLSGPGTLIFLKDGLTCRPKRVELGCSGLLVVASANGLQTDLTEFSIIENKNYKARVKAIQKLVRSFLEEVMIHRAEFQPLKSTAATTNAYEEDVRQGIQGRLPRF